MMENFIMSIVIYDANAMERLLHVLICAHLSLLIVYQASIPSGIPLLRVNAVKLLTVSLMLRHSAVIPLLNLDKTAILFALKATHAVQLTANGCAVLVMVIHSLVMVLLLDLLANLVLHAKEEDELVVGLRICNAQSSPIVSIILTMAVIRSVVVRIVEVFVAVPLYWINLIGLQWLQALGIVTRIILQKAKEGGILALGLWDGLLSHHPDLHLFDMQGCALINFLLLLKLHTYSLSVHLAILIYKKSKLCLV
jgi:hypothetical protein